MMIPIGISLYKSTKNTQNKVYPFKRLFDHEGTTVVGILRVITVEIFEHPNIKYCDEIDHRWMYFEQVLRGKDL